MEDASPPRHSLEMSLTQSYFAAAPSQDSPRHDLSLNHHNGIYTATQPLMIPTSAPSYPNSSLAMAYTPASAASKASTAANSPNDAFSMSHYQRSVDRAAPISLPPSAMSDYPSPTPIKAPALSWCGEGATALDSRT